MNSLTAKPRDLSFEASLLAQLSEEQQERLTETLDRYLSSLEQGVPLAKAELLAQHPDLASVLETYFKSLESLHQMAATFGPADVHAAERAQSRFEGQRRVGDFELLREVGRGGMGVVYEARQISLDRIVAVKLLPFSSVLDTRQIARFKYEAYTAAQLQHPNIVSVLSVGEDAGVHYYAMPFIHGRPLDQVVAEMRAAPAPRFAEASGVHAERIQNAIRWAIQAAEALQAAHENGVVHRDIKPSNLLLEPNGKLWVTDFGLARCKRNASLTRTGDLIGTLRYMSPEQAAGKRELIDHRTDIYSLGASLYELICLQPAFGDESGPRLLQLIEKHDPPRLRSLRPEVSADLETVVRKAMAKSRDERYATAGELAADLRRVLEGQPIAARPAAIVERVRRRLRRNTAAVLVTLGLTMAACLGLLLSTFFLSAGKSLSPKRERADLANAFAKLAPWKEEAGATEEALAAHEQAVVLFQGVTNSSPAIQQQAALARNNWAMALCRAGRRDEAFEQFTAAVAAQRSLVNRAPEDADLRADLALTLNNLGLLQQAVGRREAAQASFESAAELLTRLTAADPQNAEFARRLAAVWNSLGGTHLDSSPRRAIELFARALAIQSAEPTRERALTLHNLGSAYARTRDVEHAIACLRQARDLFEGLLEESPGRKICSRDLAVTCNSLGLVYVRSGDLAQAEAMLRCSLQLHEQIAESAPTDAAAASALRSVESNLAVVLKRRTRENETRLTDHSADFDENGASHEAF